MSRMSPKEVYAGEKMMKEVVLGRCGVVVGEEQ